MNVEGLLFWLNPIIVRELRRFWRMPWTFWLFGACTSLLALMVGFQYDDSGSAGGTNPRELFESMSTTVLVGLLVLGPALAATSVAAERERGLLESLQLSDLTPFQVACGKLWAAVSVLGLMLLVTLPITGVLILLGGNSPDEFLCITVLQATTAIAVTALSIACSARSRRGMGALIASFALCIGGCIGSGAISTISTPIGTPLAGVISTLIAIIAQSNPFTACSDILGATAGKTWATGLPGLAGWIYGQGWYGCLVCELLGTLAALCIAARAIRKPLADQSWLELPGQGVPDLSATTQPRHPLLWEIPTFALSRVDNPVFQRELRGKMRMRRPQGIVGVIALLLAAGIVAGYGYALYYVVAEPLSSEGVFGTVACLGLLMAMLAGATMGAVAFSREREAGTWEGLRLALLSPRQIINGKLGAIVWTCAIYSISLWPLLLCCTHGNLFPDTVQSGIGLLQVCGVLLIAGATTFAYGSWGMFISWRTQRVTASVSWTLGSLLLGSMCCCCVQAPFYTMMALLQAREDSEYLLAPLIYALLASIVGLVILTTLHGEMEKELGVPPRPPFPGEE